MARTKKTFDSMCPSDLIATACLVKAIPVSAIEAAMASASKGTLRRRKLSIEFLVYYVVFLSIYFRHSTSEVLKYILNGMSDVFPDNIQGVACEAAISQGRSRLGEEVMHNLFMDVCQPVADADTPKPWAFYKGLRLTAIDGSDIDLPDEKAIRKEHPIANDGGKNKHPCPKLRFAAIMEVGTRIIFDAEIASTLDENGVRKTLGPKDDSEKTLSMALFARLKPGLLVLGDRYYPSCDIIKTIVERGSHFLIRAKDNMNLNPIKYLKDGSYLAELSSKRNGCHGSAKVMVRVIEYCIYNKEKQIVGRGRLITSLFDEDKYPASELVKLYHERWEIEISYDEIKAHLMNGSLKGLRSKTPALARQEFWGMLIAHYVIRKTIHEAAEKSGRDPDSISFSGTVEVIRRHVGAAIFPPHEKCPSNLE
jgi:hypothetical protein